MDDNLKESELFRLLTEKGFYWISDFKKYLNEFRNTFKFKLTSYCAIRNKPSDEWTLFFGKVLFLPAFLEKQGNDIEEDFKKKCKNKYNCASERIIINIKFEESDNSEKIDEIFIDAINEGKIKNEGSFYLKPPVNESPEPFFKFYPDSTVIPYGDLYINGKSRNIWTDLGLRIKELLEKTPFGNEIELRKYLSLNEFFNFGNPEYVEYTDNSAIHIQFIPPIYFKGAKYSNYNGCPIWFRFERNVLDQSKISKNYEFYGPENKENNSITNEINNVNEGIKGIKVKKKKSLGYFKIGHSAPKRALENKIKFTLKYNNLEVHSFKKSYQDIFDVFIAKVKEESIKFLSSPIFFWLKKKNLKYTLTILPFLGLAEFIFYIHKYGGQLPISLLNPELFIIIPILYMLSVVLLYILLFTIPLILPFYINEAVEILRTKSSMSIFNRLEKILVVLYSPLIIVVYFAFEFFLLYLKYSPKSRLKFQCLKVY